MKKVSKFLFVAAMTASSSANGGVFDDMEVPPVDDNQPADRAPTFGEIVERFLAQDILVPGEKFRFCVGTECVELEKKSPAPTPTTGTAFPDRAGQLATALLKATGGYVQVTFTYKRTEKNSDGTFSTDECSVTINAGTGELPSGKVEADGKYHK